MIVYIYTFPNGKKYIGQTTQTLAQRAARGKGYKHSLPVYNAIQKYGWDNIHKEIFECQSENEMDSLERELIKKYNTTNRKFGYNLEDGGNKNKHLSKETRQKISQSLQGHLVSTETREKMSKSQLGKHLSEEHKKKIGKGNKGKVISKETKEKISIAKGRPVICIETKNIYPSVGIAAKAIGIKNGGNIIAVCKGTRQTTGGYH